MPKAEWGKKVVCANCGVKFYNLNRKPAICPSCGTEYVDQTNDLVINNTKQVINDDVDIVADNNLVGSNADESIAEDEDLNIDDAIDDETISLDDAEGDVEVIPNDVGSLDIDESNPSDIEEE